MTQPPVLPVDPSSLLDPKGSDDRQWWRLAFLLWGALGLLLILSGGCAKDKPGSQGTPAPGASMAPAPRRAESRPATPRDAATTSPAAPPRRPAVDAGAPDGPRPVSATPGGALVPLPAAVDLGEEARRLFDTLFCEGRQADRHCQTFSAAMEKYRKGYRDPMRAWLAKERPADLPETLLYPFAGADLVSALSAFPDQRRFVHVSLEHGGPPDPLRTRPAAQVGQARAMLFRMAELLLRHGESFSVDLQKQEQALLPGVLPMLLVGVKLHGGKVTGLAYLRVTPQGGLVPWTRAELQAAGPRARRLYTTWKDPRFSDRFTHLELRFRLPGDTTDRRVIHLSANLANVGLRRAPGVVAYVESLGPVALMIKASSYLMWTRDFSRIKELIFARARFAISDFTAPYPGWLRKRGFQLALHGQYDCMRNPRLRQSAGPWMNAFRKPTSRLLPFRWGYIDCKNQNHVVLIRK